MCVLTLLLHILQTMYENESAWVTAAIGLLAVILYLIYERIKFIKKVNAVPGPPTAPFIGNILDFLCDADELWKVFRKMHYKYNHIYRWWNGYEGVFVITSPDDVEQILSSNKTIEKSRVYYTIESWLNKGLLTSGGHKWHNRRKILTPAFHFNILQKFLPVFIEHSENLVQLLKSETKNDHTNVHHYIAQTTLKTICETAMGTRLDTKNMEHRNYIQAVKRYGELVVYRLIRPWLFFYITWNLTPAGFEESKVVKVLHKFSKSVISERKKIANSIESVEDNSTDDNVYKGKKRLAMLDLLLSAKSAGADIDDNGIREEVDTFMFEGHDTISTSLCYSLMLLACHKEIQEKASEEINEVLAGNWPPTYQDLQTMQYLERCIKESLRLYPSVPHMSRSIDHEITTKSGYVLPVGSIVIIHSYDVHRIPEIYPDPEKFDPDRFLPENTKGRHPYSYIPFSAGPRNCIGQRFAMMEMKTILSAILKNYILEPVDTPPDVTIVCHLVLRTKEGIRVRFRPRIYNAA